MNALSTVVGARIFTTSNSVLYVDVGSGELTHGPIEVSPANVHFVPETGQSDCRRGWLIHDTGRDARAYCLPEGSFRLRIRRTQIRGRRHADLA